VFSDPINFIDPNGLTWFKPDNHEYKVGRAGTIVPEGPDGWGRYLDNYFPAMHTTGYYHDALIAKAERIGWLPDWAVNIPTIPIVWVFSVGVETGNSIMWLFGYEGLQHNVEKEPLPDRCM